MSEADEKTPSRSAAPDEESLQRVRDLIGEKSFDAARDILLNLVSRREASAEAYNLLGNIRMTSCAFSEARKCYESALSMNPDYPEALNNLANVHNHCARVDDAIRCYKRALELRPDLDKVRSNMLLSMNYSSTVNRDELLQASREWYRQHCRHLAPVTFRTPPIPGKRLTIGYVSYDFRHHPVGFLFPKVVQNHDRESFRVICYSTNPLVDSFTRELMQTTEWRDMSGADDDALVGTIVHDNVDILVDLSGHTAGNRLTVFARRPAPVQVSWIGYYNTTGIPQMDYHITDNLTVPAGEEKWFAEEVVRLDGSRFCYAPPPYAPPVSELPCLRTGRITFGSFNNLAKLNREVVLTWSRLLDAVPDSRLILKWPSLQEESVRHECAAMFGVLGINGDRLELRAASRHADMLREYGDIDMALDPFPYSGGMTSLEALWMGVPVMTLPLSGPASRQSASFLHLLGLENYISSSVDEYVALGKDNALNGKRLAMTRSILRLRVDRTLCDGKGFMRQVESRYRAMWERYVTGNSAVP